MNYYFEPQFFANSQLTTQQQEKPTREQMLKQAFNEVAIKNQKINADPFNKQSTIISAKQLENSKIDLNKIMGQGTQLAKEKSPELWDNDPNTNPVDTKKSYSYKVIGKLSNEEIRKKALALAKESKPELWDNHAKQILTDKPSEFDNQAPESHNNGVLIWGICLFILTIILFFKWKKSLFKRLIRVKNLMVQKFKFEDSIRAKKAFNLFGIIWVLFHLFMLITSEDIFKYSISWRGFWHFDYFEDSYNRPYGYESHYDITEFSIYVIIPIVIIFGRKYLNGEQLFSFKVRASIMKSNTDIQFNELKKYKELFDLGVISEAEFIEQKRKILNK